MKNLENFKQELKQTFARMAVCQRCDMRTSDVKEGLCVHCTEMIAWEDNDCDCIGWIEHQNCHNDHCDSCGAILGISNQCPEC